jgi:hypothetical protein
VGHSDESGCLPDILAGVLNSFGREEVVGLRIKTWEPTQSRKYTTPYRVKVANAAGRRYFAGLRVAICGVGERKTVSMQYAVSATQTFGGPMDLWGGATAQKSLL